MFTEDINIRDPFVLPYDGKFYLYGTRGKHAFVGWENGFDVYVSEDLIHWSEAVEVFHKPKGFWSRKSYWAPEVHRYGDAFYMFATFANKKGGLGTAILRAEHPLGPFTLWSDGYVTPKEWRCLDGTLYVSKSGKPYMIFCHEWRQIHDGTMCMIALREDLKESIGEPEILFSASQAKPFVKEYFKKNYVTDGPFLLRTEDDRLHMLWSTNGQNGYVEAMAHVDGDEIHGRWTIDEQLLYDHDGGHGMIFQDFQGQYYLVLHYPNTFCKEHPVFIPLQYKDGAWCSKES